MGPLELCRFHCQLDVCLAVMQVLYEGLYADSTVTVRARCW